MIGKKTLNPTRKRPSLKNKDFVTPYNEMDVKFEIIGAIVKARISKELSQKALADKLKIAQSSYARFESGRTNPTLSFIQKVMNELGLEIEVVEV
jgi:predicted transcriptional regulator